MTTFFGAGSPRDERAASATHGGAVEGTASRATAEHAAHLLAVRAQIERIIARSLRTGGVDRPVAEEHGVGATVRVTVPAEVLTSFYEQLRRRLPVALVTMVAFEEPAAQGVFALRYVFAVARTDVYVELHVTLDGGSATAPGDVKRLEYPSLTRLLPAANWYEREARDLYGLEPVGHPDPSPLVPHNTSPADVAPLWRASGGDGTTLPSPHVGTSLRPTPIQGEGLMEIAVGPIHAGVIEPGHFRFTSVGEQIVHLDTRFFYTHRGVEKRAEGMSFERALPLVERNCAACTVSSTLAYCQALETLAGIDVPLRAQVQRVLYAEMERLYNHVGDIGNICAGIGFHAGAQLGARLKERLLALNERLVGSRYLFGVLRPGGVRREFTREDGVALGATLDELVPACDQMLRMIWSNVGTVDRLTGTGILPREVAQALGAVGVAARASGIARDVRRDHPYAAYRMLTPVPVAVRPEGDVAARLRVRADEINSSCALLREALTLLPYTGALSRPLGTLPASESALSVTESPRGANCHWVLVGRENTLARYRIRSASYANWPAVPRAVEGAIVPDFPLINKSFELCYSCLDR